MLKRKIGVAAVLGLLASVSLYSVGFAQCPPLTGPSSPLIEWDANGFAYETSYAGYLSAGGSVLTVVGKIDLFYAPLSGLNGNMPGTEYTFVMSGLTSAGTTTSVNGPTTNYDTNYSGGTFAIYEDTTPDAPAPPTPPPPGGIVPANYQDGVVILSGDLCGFNTKISVTTVGSSTIVSGNFSSNYRFTGGTLQGAVGDAWALLEGLWCAKIGTGCRPAGYTAHPNGKFDSPPSTPTLKSTWGALKTLYR